MKHMRLISSVHIFFHYNWPHLITFLVGFFFHFKRYSIDVNVPASFLTHKVFSYLSKPLGYALEQP